jgi:hypothetical protein
MRMVSYISRKLLSDAADRHNEESIANQLYSYSGENTFGFEESA